MKYSKPEIKILELNVVDVIATSGFEPDENQTPLAPPPAKNASSTVDKSHWDNN